MDGENRRQRQHYVRFVQRERYQEPRQILTRLLRSGIMLCQFFDQRFMLRRPGIRRTIRLEGWFLDTQRPCMVYCILITLNRCLRDDDTSHKYIIINIRGMRVYPYPRVGYGSGRRFTGRVGWSLACVYPVLTVPTFSFWGHIITATCNSESYYSLIQPSWHILNLQWTRRPLINMHTYTKCFFVMERRYGIPTPYMYFKWWTIKNITFNNVIQLLNFIEIN